MSRPEHIAPPEIFYNDDEARKYTSNSRMIQIQAELTERAIELLKLPEDSNPLVLDVGCGSGLSGEVLSEHGYQWVGVDISRSMLSVAVDAERKGDVLEWDIGCGLPFKPASFDAVISISAIQWLCNADFSGAVPHKRLSAFFSSLYHSLQRGGKAVLQWYPENSKQMEMVTGVATRCGFTGGLLVDFPNSTKAKKYYLVLFTGGGVQALPQALGTENSTRSQAQVDRSGRSYHDRSGPGNKRGPSHRDWVKHKKDRARAQVRRNCNTSNKFCVLDELFTELVC